MRSTIGIGTIYVLLFAGLSVWLLPAIKTGAAAGKPLALHSANPRYFLFRGKPTVIITSAEHLQRWHRIEGEKMILKKSALLSVFCLLTFASASQGQDARKIMEGVYKQDTSRDTTWRGKLDVVDKKGTVRSKKFTMRKLGGLGNSKTLVRFTDPPEVRGVGLLSINQGGVADRLWMYTPAIRRVRRLAAQERRQRFFGADFTNEDMSERVLDDFTYKLIGDGEEIDRRKTYKIEARPVSPDKSQYAYVYIWVPKDAPYSVLVEMYDKQGQKQRILKAGNLEKISGIWVAKRVEMSTPPEGTKTILTLEDIRFNTGLKEDMFTQQALEKPDIF